MRQLLGYHGTPAWREVLLYGLLADKASGGCPHVWLTVRPKDAAPFGVVLEVNMTGLDFGWQDKDEPLASIYQPYWQGCYHGGDVPPRLIKLYRGVRRVLWDEQGGLCVYCRQPMHWTMKGEAYDWDAATLDHKVPKALGGGNEPENLALACKACNTYKGKIERFP